MLIHLLKFIPFTNTARMRRMIIQKNWEGITKLYEGEYVLNLKRPNVLILFYSARAYTNLKQKEKAMGIWNTIPWFKNASFQKERLEKQEIENKVLVTENNKITIVVFPTNGVGFGHFTRILSIAKRIKKINSEIEIIFFTTMSTLHILKEQGNFVAYHIPGRKKFKNMEPKDWNLICEDFLKYIFKTHKPNYFIFDGVFPYRGMLNSINNRKDITTFWIRRGCLKIDKRKEIIESTKLFDYIIKPKDSMKLDLEKNEENLITCNPILLLEKNELMNKKEACIRLGVPKDAIIVYVQLGAGNINDIDSEINMTLSILKKYEDIYVVLGESMIGERLKIIGERVRIIRDYPNSIFFKAFDFAIMAAGYNSFHEAVQFCLPTIFYPNMSTKQDDQFSRAKVAEDAGAMLVLKKRSQENISNAIKILYNKNIRKMMKEKSKSLQSENGAEQIAKLLVDMIDKE